MIYLDYNATTPIAPPVLEAMRPYLDAEYGNPSSSHPLGRSAHRAVENARSQVATLLGAAADEIVFTSGGTEANNWAIKGAAFAKRFDGATTSGHLVISAIEHPAVVEPIRFLERLGYEVAVVGVDRRGAIDADAVRAALRPDTLLVSVMHANNEVGTIQPIRTIAQHCRAAGVLLHTDAAQSVGKVRVHVDELGVDLLTVAGHKLYAPKGVGALYVRRGVRLEPLLHGASHERGLRAGTENVPYIVALGAAAAMAGDGFDEMSSTMERLRDRLLARLRANISPALTVNGEGAPRLPNTLSVNFPGVQGGDLLRLCPELCASTGSACHSGSTSLSSTLAAMGVAAAEGAGCVRLSVGRFTQEEEIDRAADWLAAAWQCLMAKCNE
ncbi:MAG: cysteine desulfurase family protein [Pirellulales bacterium]